MMRFLMGIGLVLGWLVTAQANVALHQFEQPEQSALYHEMIGELRCLVCQNQNIAESNAPLAKDLREQTYRLIVEQSANKAQIVDFMTQRYGDFVLYKPPVQANTLLLWLAPLLLLSAGAWLMRGFVRQASRAADEEKDV
jgi:cytochrome c-type biogenesis protein CcmH